MGTDTEFGPTHARLDSAPCTVCGSDNTSAFGDVLQVPVHSSVLWKNREEALRAPCGDIELVFCRNCGHVFNRAFDAGRTAYSPAYENSLHFSPLFQGYAQYLADLLIDRYQLAGKRVIEIGCGQADFLSLLCQKAGCRGLGFDPSFEPGVDPHGLIADGQLEVVRDFYSDRYSNAAADLILCRQALEHIPQPRQFLRGIRTAVEGSRGAVFFEVPNALCALRDGDIWTLIYEHCSFYSASSLETLFRLSGFDAVDIGLLYHDLFLGIHAAPRSSAAAAQRSGVQELSAYVDGFAQMFNNKLLLWQGRFEAIAAAGQRVVVWGGGARGVTFLNLLREAAPVQYIVDINPRKTGAYAPGTGQEFVLPEFLQSYQPDVIVVMNAVYENEIRETLGRLGISAVLLPA